MIDNPPAISWTILSPWVEEGYRRTEEKTTRNGQTSFYDYLKKEGFLIEEGEYFALVADPVPEFNGGLLITAREKQNIVEMNGYELEELGKMRKLARVMLEIQCNGLPSNDYMIQTFGNAQDKYPNTRFNLPLVPRGNVQACVELGTKIVGLDEDPKQLAETMRRLKDSIITRLS